MKQENDIQSVLASIDISEKEKKTIRDTASYRKNIPFIAIITFIVIYEFWVYRYLLWQDIFFMIFNCVFYGALIWSAIWTCLYQKKINLLLIKLLRLINEKHDSVKK